MGIRQAQMKAEMKTLRSAGLRLLQTYADLSDSKGHLLDEVLGDAVPLQWAHYPPDDAIDLSSGFQWFYTPTARKTGLWVQSMDTFTCLQDALYGRGACNRALRLNFAEFAGVKTLRRTHDICLPLD